MNRNERTPRTLAETSFTTGYPVHEARRGFREGVVAGLFLSFLFTMLFGLHFVAAYLGD